MQHLYLTTEKVDFKYKRCIYNIEIQMQEDFQKRRHVSALHHWGSSLDNIKLVVYNMDFNQTRNCYSLL